MAAAQLKVLAAWYEDIGRARPEIAARGKTLLRSAADANVLTLRGPGLLRATSARSTRELFESLIAHAPLFFATPGSQRRIRETGTKERVAYTCDVIDAHALMNISFAVRALFARGDSRFAAANMTNLITSAFELHHDVHLMEVWGDHPDDNGLHEYVGSGFADRIPDILKDRCALTEAKWWQGLLDFTDDFRPIPPCFDGTYGTVVIDRIDPKVQCAGRWVVLYGTFPPAQQPELKVLFPTTQGYKEPDIAVWRSDLIAVVVPGDATHGCVWIYDKAAEVEYAQCMHASAKQVASDALGLGLVLAPELTAMVFGIVPDPPEFCSADAFFEGYIASIEDLAINGTRAMGQVRVWNGRDMNITFRIYAGTNAYITILNDDDNSELRTSYLPPGTTSFVYRPQVTVPTQLLVRIIAKSECTGTYSRREARVLVQMPPNIQLVGIEATQATQRYTLPPSGTANSVTLLQGRSTMFRAYIDSGVTSGTDRTVRITGKLTVAGVDFEPVNDGTYVAKPVGDTDRATMNDSLNFIVPGSLVTRQDVEVHLSVEVPDFYPGIGDDSGAHAASARLWFHFVPGGGFRVMGILVDDARYGLTVNEADLLNAISGMTARLPVRDDGIELWVPADSSDAHTSTDKDLVTNAGWEDLVEDIGEMAEDYEDDGEHWIGIVPQYHAYRWGGMADWGPFSGPYCTAQAIRGCATHEMIHTFGVDHANCGRDLRGTDPRLDTAIPTGRTEEVGVDVWNQKTYAAGVGDIMSYCGGCDDRWTSIAVWDLMRGLV